MDHHLLPAVAAAATILATGCHTTPDAPPAGGAAREVELAPGVRVDLVAPVVELRGTACLDAGWLEQIACAPNSREHESLVVVEARPSDIHAALLLAGFEPGRPGRWTYDGEYRFVAPEGDRLAVHARYVGADGATVVEPIGRWIADGRGEQSFPDLPWVFGGSRFEPNPPGTEPGEHYVADFTGSVIGLVTFGDEVVGFSEVIADETDVQAPLWQVATDRVPPVGTEVVVLLSRYDAE